MIWKDTWTLMFMPAVFAIPKTWKQPKCPTTDEWIKKLPCMLQKCYSVIKKEWHNDINKEEPGDYHTKQSTSERERQIPDMWNQNDGTDEQMNISMKQKQTHRHRDKICSCQGRGAWEREGLGAWD